MGWLKPGSLGDATVLSVDEVPFDYVDVTGEHPVGHRKINSRGVATGGKWWWHRLGSRAAPGCKAR